MNTIQSSCSHRHQSVDDRAEGLEPIVAGFPEACGYESRAIMVLIEMWETSKAKRVLMVAIL